MAPRSKSKAVDGPFPQIIPPSLTLVHSDSPQPDDGKPVIEDGSLKVEHSDGSVTIHLGKTQEDATGPETKGFHANLAHKMDDGDLGQVSSNLIEGIQRDEESRKEWVETRALGINLLGLRLEKPRADPGSASAPLEGMSTVRHPLLLEATVTFQATARAELLPASGIVKVRNDSPLPPQNIQQDTNAQQELSDSLAHKDELAQALEKDFNHWLTDVATEYIPDTDRMLFYVGFGGDGFKKVYNCPLRRRPVSESIDAEDLIISNTSTDLRNCGRVTHRIKMRQSTLKRMQILGVYRDVELSKPAVPTQNAAEKKKEEVSGQTTTNKRPEDRDYEIYEIYCELDLDEFAPEEFKGKGLPLPYRVTIEKDSRQVLDVRRNWDEDDDQCLAKQFFVQYPFIRGLGFYGLGFVHLLGNTTNALTAAWREMLDAGMFANFPGFLVAKGAVRQNTNQFRVPPGGSAPIDIGAQQSIKDAIMPLPYKEVGASFTAFVTHVEEGGRRLASTGTINVGEGKQDAPVGTTLALLEQASKVIDSSHKRLHAAQTEEFKLLKERFKEDPEAFWRHNKKTVKQWQKDQFIEALNSYELVPVADPNNPTSLHRLAKATVLKTLQQQSPDLYDPIAVEMRVLRTADIDPQGLFRATPPTPPPDPRMEAIKSKAEAAQNQAQIQLLETKIKAASEAAKIQDKAQDRASKERIAAMQLELQNRKIRQEELIHAHDAQRDAAMAAHNMQLESASKAQELHHEAISRGHEIVHDRTLSAHEEQMARDKHNAEMRRADEEHTMKMAHARELHAQKLEAAKALARVKPKKAKE